MKLMRVHTLVLGSGAAGLAAAVRLRAEGIDDLVVLSEGLNQGTSINTGSDKQTYYKQGLYGRESDSPGLMADSYLSGGSAHGDLAMTESAVSTRAFFHLVNLGVPFPHDESGQYIGYKTDHDPRRRATSCGPYTSRRMCQALIREVIARRIDVREHRIAVKLAVVDQSEQSNPRIAGLIAINTQTGELEAWRTDRIVFAVGGPGGLYRSSVYPAVQTGAIGLALEVGAKARNLPESQFGLASFTDLSQRDLRCSTDTNGMEPATVEIFRWNVSGSFMQVIPRFISTDANGHEPVEFLRPWFDSTGTMNTNVFLKGYQWPFDVRKALAGSSLIDLIVYYETVVRGRRAFLDFRSNPDGLNFGQLAHEAYEYLEKCDAAFGTPLERLRRMNPAAIELYRDHGIDLASEPLEIAVCSQHNNGGLAGDVWYHSENVMGLFPIGEVNGSHGVTRPGGSALNAGQVGAFRAARYIACHASDSEEDDESNAALQSAYRLMSGAINELNRNPRNWQSERDEFQRRMSRFGSHFRSISEIGEAVDLAWSQFDSLRLDSEFTERSNGSACPATYDTVESLRNMQLCLAHAVYLESIEFQLKSGVGSRGSGAVLAPDGKIIHPGFPNEWRLVPEDEQFRNLVLETQPEPLSFFRNVRIANRNCRCSWEPVRPLPDSDDWFECVWERYRNDDIYNPVSVDIRNMPQDS